jgi:hypothetical protein
MAEWFYHLPIVWMSLVVLVATGIVAALIYAAVMTLAIGERARAFKGISPVMLTPLAVVFGLIVGFLAAQVWSDSDRAAATVTREARALRTIVVLAASFPGPSEGRIRALVREHVEDAVNDEWPAMARQQANLAALTRADSEALDVVLSVPAQTASQQLAQRELLSALQNALDARRDRIVISMSSINAVKWAVVLLLAGLILLTIAMIHCDNRLTAALAMGIFSVGVAACVVLIASHNRPFTGEISVSPKLLTQVMPKD